MWLRLKQALPCIKHDFVSFAQSLSLTLDDIRLDENLGVSS
jgi:hypothetical protein